MSNKAEPVVQTIHKHAGDSSSNTLFKTTEIHNLVTILRIQSAIGRKRLWDAALPECSACHSTDSLQDTIPAIDSGIRVTDLAMPALV